jgi:hypothetical protein
MAKATDTRVQVGLTNYGWSTMLPAKMAHFGATADIHSQRAHFRNLLTHIVRIRIGNMFVLPVSEEEPTVGSWSCAFVADIVAICKKYLGREEKVDLEAIYD